MVIKRPKVEEIVVKLRQVEVLMEHRMPRIDVIKQISVIEQTYYRWKKNYGEMGMEQLKKLKRLHE
jgi:putative transposase